MPGFHLRIASVLVENSEVDIVGTGCSISVDRVLLSAVYSSIIIKVPGPRCR